MVRGLWIIVFLTGLSHAWDPAFRLRSQEAEATYGETRRSAGVAKAVAGPSGRTEHWQIRLKADPTWNRDAQDKGPDPAVTRASDLVRRWRVVIGTIFEERRASAMEPIMDELEIVISPGAVKAAQDRASAQQLKAADDLMQRFALAMVAAGERLSDGSVHIGEEAIDAGLTKVCPAYPLCPK